MTQEDVTIRLTAHEHEIGSLKHRVKHVESQVEAINKLTASVENLASSVQEMLRVQKEQGTRLLRLECRPAQEARSVRREVIKAAVSAMVGAMITVILQRL
jgi:translation initiation factor 2B subunit (eIF-2B alpha/beta/delta family)